MTSDQRFRADEVEQAAEAAIGVAPARLELDREHQILGIGRRALGNPSVGEQAHAVPGARARRPGPAGRRPTPSTPSPRVSAPEAVDLAVLVEGGERGRPVARQRRPHGHHLDVLGDDRHDPARVRRGRSGRRSSARGRRGTSRRRGTARRRSSRPSRTSSARSPVTSTRSTRSSTPAALTSSARPPDHPRRRLDDRDVVPGARQRDALVPAPPPTSTMRAGAVAAEGGPAGAGGRRASAPAPATWSSDRRRSARPRLDHGSPGRSSGTPASVAAVAVADGVSSR